MSQSDGRRDAELDKGAAAPPAAAVRPENPDEGVAERPDRRLLELLVCPVTKAGLRYDATRQELISEKARLAYPIRRGVPHMVPSEARLLEG